jgi:hypothetical protein
LKSILPLQKKVIILFRILPLQKKVIILFRILPLQKKVNNRGRKVKKAFESSSKNQKR